MECFTPEEIRTHLASLRLADKEKIQGQGQPSASTPKGSRARGCESDREFVQGMRR